MAWRVAASLQQLLAEVNASAPNRSKASDGALGDAQHSSRASDHNPCDCHGVVCARDFTHDPAGGFDAHAFADWLVAEVRSGEPRVKYVISRGKIASGHGQAHPAGVWRPYSGANAHVKHTHVSVRHPQVLFDDDRRWGWGVAVPAPPPPVQPSVPIEAAGVADMHIVIAGKGLYALFGQVLYQFQTLQEYAQAREKSEKVPLSVVGDEVPDAGRQWLVDRLQEASAKACAG